MLSIYLSIERETERKRHKRKDYCKELAQNCKVCSQQAGDPRELMVHVQSESWQAQDPEGANVLSLKVGKKKQCPSLKIVRQKEFSLLGEGSAFGSSGF